MSSGAVTHAFPSAAAPADADLAELGMRGSRRATDSVLAGALCDASVGLDTGVDRDAAEKALPALHGVGPWRAGYIRTCAPGTRTSC